MSTQVRYLKETGIFSFLKMVFKLKETVFENKEEVLLDFINKNPKAFFDILGNIDGVIIEAPIEDILKYNRMKYSKKVIFEKRGRGRPRKETPIQPIGLELTKDFFFKKIKEVNLTFYQKIILKEILEKENHITLNELEQKLKEKNIDVTTGSVIGGSLAGISKKCERENLPRLYDIINNSNSEKEYTIIPQVKDFLTEYLARIS